MTVLVTGATGFVGSAVLRALLDAGQAVRALVRAGSDRRNLEGLDVEPVEGELGDAASLARAVAASTTMRPVGVGLTSRGPIGVEGLTMTTGRPSAAISVTACSARNFERL